MNSKPCILSLQPESSWLRIARRASLRLFGTCLLASQCACSLISSTIASWSSKRSCKLPEDHRARLTPKGFSRTLAWASLGNLEGCITLRLHRSPGGSETARCSFAGRDRPEFRNRTTCYVIQDGLLPTFWLCAHSVCRFCVQILCENAVRSL